eukprot:TRINITY_DN42105_c0_g1_i1.p1 TRINITY_DN42105_c0_g1~~TRINITY_DN42105_c0_g1_i1.p1  ORF type:complete len:372 (-),score=62.86 TRINITY_DN42105_c0_g1_i1:199-1314(-)
MSDPKRARLNGHGDVVVSSWDDFSPLKHIIVGNAEGACTAATDIRGDSAGGRKPAEMIREATVLLNNYADILKGEGLRVDRCAILDWHNELKTPLWSQPNEVGTMPPRDTFLTIGSEFLECPLASRARYFEIRSVRGLFKHYFESCPTMRWTSAPRPMLADSLFNKEYVFDRSLLDFSKPMPLTEEEPIFDAADVLRVGKDVFVRRSVTTNDLGLKWLQRHYGGQHRVHRIEFNGSPLPIHMDASFVTLRPGLAISNPTQPLSAESRKYFEDNGWTIERAPEPAHDGPPPNCTTSRWCSMNVLIIDPKTVCVEATETPTIEFLQRHGFRTIPVPMRHAYGFGGGLHCATADVWRDGPCKDYFPLKSEDKAP